MGCAFSAFCLSAPGTSGADFFCRFAKINLQCINMYCIFVGTKAKKMDRTHLLNWLKKHQKPGVYHNGGFGFPSLQVNVSESETGFSVTVFHNSKMETFHFTRSEFQ